MKEMIYQTVCPGCNMGCGLYVREDDEGTVAIDFMKSSSANLGKLCRFGMQLPHHYSKATSMVDGVESSIEDAIQAASTKLKGAKDIAMLSVGATTSEEHLAFTKVANALDTVVNTGMGTYAELPPECHATVGQGIPLEDVELASKIALFIDPYTQYPLIVRRLLAAKRNGASIVAVGPKEIKLADETKHIGPDQYESELGLDSESMIIADVHPHSDPEHVKHLLNLALMTGAKIMFMKPFVDSTGVHLLSKGTGQKGLQEIMDGINEGTIKTLVTLDSDPLELMPNGTEDILKKLDNLVVISSRNSPVTKLAQIVIGTEPLYAKAGSFMNTEGQVLKNSGEGTVGIDALSTLAQNLGGEAFDCQDLHTQVLENVVKEYTGGKYKKLSCEIIETAPEEGKGNLINVYNPFMWFDQPDDNDFVMVNMNTVKSLGLQKGGMIALTSNGGIVKMRYAVAEIPDGLILTNKKLPITTGTCTVVTAEGC
jgi:predicted molibdopterin-dependent oxidoreductase YjgC